MSARAQRAAPALAGLFAALLAASPAPAVSIDAGGSSLNGNLLTDHSGPGQLSFDLELVNEGVVTLKVDFDPGESSVSWNALFTDLTGLLSETYQASWGGAVVAGQGTLRDGFDREVGGVTLASGDQVAVIGFDDPGEAAGFTLGDPGGLIAGAADWQVEAPTNGASVTLVLPEPRGSGPLWIACVALATLARRRGRPSSPMGLRRSTGRCSW